MLSTLETKTSSFELTQLWAIGSVLLLVGCGASSTARTLGGNCKKSPAVTSGGTGTSGKTSLTADDASGFNLASNLATPSGDPGIGTGYLDISTKTNSGQSDARRCTMHLRPVDSSDNKVRVWTAGHCFFDPQTDRFQNSKYTLQIYLRGGYFKAPVTFEGLAELANFSKAAASTLALPGLETSSGLIKGQIFQALPSATGENCLKDEKIFAGTLSTKKQIACFARSEMRGFKATLTLDGTAAGFMKEVMTSLRQRETATLAKLDSKTKSLLKFYEEAHNAERRRVADLRSVAYMLNKQICDIYNTSTAAQKEKDPQLLDTDTNVYDSVELCKSVPGFGTVRDLVIGQLSSPSVLPSADFLMMKKYFDDTSTNLQSLRRQTIGCNKISVDNISLTADQLTPCDMGWIATALWNRYVDQGTTPTTSVSLNDPNVFGFNKDSFLSIATNAAQTAAQKSSGARGKPRILPLNTNSVLNFGFKVSDQYSNTMLMNFDAANQGLFMTKGDSGSMLSIFGYFPMGLLSTVDGEKTSGGASILPLPEVGEETSTSANSNAGC